jgi:hypothetical protein
LSRPISGLYTLTILIGFIFIKKEVSMANVDSAVKIAFTIMNYIKEQKYRAEVLERLNYIQDSLNRIAEGIVRIEHEVNHANAKLSLLKLYASIGGAPADVTAFYERDEFTAWLNSDGKTELPPEFIDGVKHNIKNDLIKIHDAIMGSLDLEPWLSLHIAVKRFEELPTSLCENVFHYFIGFLLAVQLKGLILLSAVSKNQSEFENYTKILKKKFEDQGDTCQKIVNQFKEEDFWWGFHDLYKAEIYTSRLVGVNPGQMPPENHVLVGYEVIEENGKLVIKCYHGKANSAGIVEDIEQLISRGTETVNFAGQGIPYIDISKIELPPDHVLIDICFYAGYPIYPAGGDEFYRALGFNYLHAKMNPDGTIDYTQGRWEFTKARDYFRRGEGIPPDPVFFAPWTKFSSTPPLKDLAMNVPLTGMQFYPAPGGKFNSAAKVDLHKNSFSGKD